MTARLGIILLFFLMHSEVLAQQTYLPGSVEEFAITDSDISLERLARPDTYFDKTGRRFAILGTESGSFEAWAFPLKLFRDFSFEFFIGSSTMPIPARDVVHRIEVRPAATTITYVFESFTIQAHFVTAVREPGAVILLDIDSTEPLSIVAGFVPTIEPMWPGGLGGQYARWDNELKAYLISESSGRNHGYIGSPAAGGLSYTPAHMLSDQPNQFRIEIESPASVEGRLVPIVMAGGPGDRDQIRETYRRLVADPEGVYADARRHFAELRARTLSVDTPVEDLDLALEWAKIAYDNLLVDNPHFEGTGLVAGFDRSGRGGRPGFGWFFGGDTYINSLSLTALGSFETVREAIGFMTRFQREDGKMAHEVTQAVEYVDWFSDYPYAYIHADTSPFYILAVYDYVLATGDTEFLSSQWEAINRAYDWSRSTDADSDGLMDNSLAGLGALEFGALTGIQSDIYLAAVWIRATEAMAAMADLRGAAARSRMASDDHHRARAAFEKYWDDAVGQYVYAFNEDGRRVQEVTPWSAVGLMFGYGSDERAASSLMRMARADLTTDWGIRMLSANSVYFEPLNYNYGAVWPFLTSWVSTAQFERGLPLQAYSGLMSTVQHVFNRSLGQVTEVFSGARHTWPQESVPHQGFCTAGTVLPFIRGLLGLSVNALENSFTFAPNVPGNWEAFSIRNIRIGGEQVEIMFVRSDTQVRVVAERSTSGPLTITFAPALSPGTRITGASVDGRAISFETRETGMITRPSVTAELGERTVIDFAIQRAFEIIPPVWKSKVGDASHGIRINRFERDGRTAILSVEGIAGEDYRLEILNPREVASVEGAVLGERALEISFPGHPSNGYVRHEISLTFVK